MRTYRVRYHDGRDEPGEIVVTMSAPDLEAVPAKIELGTEEARGLFEYALEMKGPGVSVLGIASRMGTYTTALYDETPSS